MSSIKLPKDIFTLDDDTKKKKKKKKDKHKSSHKKSHITTCYAFMYNELISAIVASSYSDDISITRYIIRGGSSYNLLEKDKEFKLSKIKYLEIRIKDTTLDLIMKNDDIRKYLRIVSSRKYNDTTYTNVRISISKLKKILEYSVSVSADRGSEITKVILNLAGVHNIKVLDKKKDEIATIIRG